VKLDQLVWQNKDVGDYINDRFISLRFTSRDDEYKVVRAEYDLKVHPTALLLKADGMEIERICGFDGQKDTYFQTFRDFTEGKYTLQTLLSEYERDPENLEMNYKIGRRYVDRRQEDQSPLYFTKVVELDPEDEYGYKTEASYYIASHEARRNKNPGPMQAFIASNTDERFLLSSYYDLVYYYMTMNKADQVISTYEELLAKKPDHAPLMYSMASYIFYNTMEDRYARGVELTNRAMELEPDRAVSGYYYLARYYTNIKAFDKLTASYEEALERWPENKTLMNFYAGDIHKNEIDSHYDRGIELIKKALDTQPEGAHFWYTLGWLYYKKGDKEEAVAAAKKAVEFMPTLKTYKDALDLFQKEDSFPRI